jgi:hypothetical protein
MQVRNTMYLSTMYGVLRLCNGCINLVCICLCIALSNIQKKHTYKTQNAIHLGCTRTISDSERCPSNSTKHLERKFLGRKFHEFFCTDTTNATAAAQVSPSYAQHSVKILNHDPPKPVWPPWHKPAQSIGGGLAVGHSYVRYAKR